MTVSSSTSRVTYAGNGATTAFSVPFYFLDQTHLQVVLRSAAGVETTQVLTTNYTVSGAGVPAGGTVTMLVAPAAGTTLAIVRSVPFTQETDYQPNDPFPAQTHEAALDKLTMEAQQLKELSDRTLRFPVSDNTAVSATLPTSAERSSKFMAFDAGGQPIAAAGGVSGLPVSAFMATVLDDATAVAARNTLGSTATGDALFTAATASAARTTLGSSATGDALFTATSAAAARSTLDAAALSQSQSWGAGQTPLTATLTDAATVNWDMATAQVGAVTCAAARTFAAPTNQVANRFYALSIANSGGAWAHAFNAAFVFDSNDGTPGSFPASARLHLIFRSDGTNLREWGRRQVAS